MSDVYSAERERFEAAGQGHVFAFWDGLDEHGRRQLLDQARSIDLGEVNGLAATLLGSEGDAPANMEGLEPAPYVAHPDRGGDPALWARARQAGEEALRAGKVAAFTVAGGQGTRLGYDGPKGTFPVTPVTGKPLFAVFAEKLQAAANRYGAEIPWFIMTSTQNHAATVAAFEESAYFGLPPERVMFFSQGRMPAVGLDGKILLEGPDCIAMSPDGHGGSLRALVRSGAVDRMKERGIEAISYFQVDNPLVQVIDPAFVGFHFLQGSEMSSKMIPKAYAGEKVGHFCLQDGRMVVVEYSDMPAAMQEQRDADGQLRFIAGSIAIHILSTAFVERIGTGGSGASLPFHKALKKIPCIGVDGRPVNPVQPNGIKFEMFVFDALPFARNPVVIETLREDDFSPVKNATGLDSPQTCRDDQLRQWARWMRAAAIDLETDETHLPKVVFEVSPLFADSSDTFAQRWAALTTKPTIGDGTLLI